VGREQSARCMQWEGVHCGKRAECTLHAVGGSALWEGVHCGSRGARNIVGARMMNSVADVSTSPLRSAYMHSACSPAVHTCSTAHGAAASVRRLH
jgi:hypothetical protein